MTELLFIGVILFCAIIYVILPALRASWRLIVKRIEMNTIKSILYGEKEKAKETKAKGK